MMEPSLFSEAFAVAAGNTPDEELTALCRYFSDVIPLPPDPLLDIPTAHHPDMLFAVIGDHLFTHESYYAHAKEAIDRICALGGFTLSLSSVARGSIYPQDIGFNGLVFGNVLMGNLRYLAPEMLAFAEKTGMKTANVRQGYTACSTLIVPDLPLAATGDRGIGAALARLDVPVTLLPADAGILLPGYDAGFIGGCTGVWDDAVFFTGNPHCHPGLEELCGVLTEHGMRLIPLSEGPLVDRGGIRIFRNR